MNTEKAILQLQIAMLGIEVHVAQVGAWEKLRGLWRILGVNARGQATSGVHPNIYYHKCPPSLCIAWIPRKGSKTPIGGL